MVKWSNVSLVRLPDNEFCVRGCNTMLWPTQNCCQVIPVSAYWLGKTFVIYPLNSIVRPSTRAALVRYNTVYKIILNINICINSDLGVIPLLCYCKCIFWARGWGFKAASPTHWQSSGSQTATWQSRSSFKGASPVLARCSTIENKHDIAQGDLPMPWSTKNPYSMQPNLAEDLAISTLGNFPRTICHPWPWYNVEWFVKISKEGSK